MVLSASKTRLLLVVILRRNAVMTCGAVKIIHQCPLNTSTPLKLPNKNMVFTHYASLIYIDKLWSRINITFMYSKLDHPEKIIAAK